jgi:hypothetical protein
MTSRPYTFFECLAQFDATTGEVEVLSVSATAELNEKDLVVQDDDGVGGDANAILHCG